MPSPVPNIAPTRMPGITLPTTMPPTTPMTKPTAIPAKNSFEEKSMFTLAPSAIAFRFEATPIVLGHFSILESTMAAPDMCNAFMAESALGGEKVGKNPTDRGKMGAKINLLVDSRGAPLSVVLTGANRHDKVSAVELIVSFSVKRPVHKEQHLCADKAYDSQDVREFVSAAGYETHIKVNPRRSRKAAEPPPDENSPKRIYPARRWMVERTISWLTKRRSLRTRWAKKAGNWLALVQLACAHILFNLAVFG